MEEALALVLLARERIPELAADDPHHVAAAHEAQAMVLCAEMYYRILLEDKEGEMLPSIEDVPIERYPFQP